MAQNSEKLTKSMTWLVGKGQFAAVCCVVNCEVSRATDSVVETRRE